MRRWQSHKIVEAEICMGWSIPQKTVTIVGGEIISVPENFFARGTPQIGPTEGDYLVRYSGGTEDESLSWSPKKVFEEGYTLLDNPDLTPPAGFHKCPVCLTVTREGPPTGVYVVGPHGSFTITDQELLPAILGSPERNPRVNASDRPLPSVRSGYAKHRWEYYVTSLPEGRDLALHMTSVGKDGWEFCCVLEPCGAGKSALYLFKRLGAPIP